MGDDQDKDQIAQSPRQPEGPVRQPAPGGAPQATQASRSRQHLLQRIQEMGFDASRKALAPDSALVRPGAAALSPDAKATVLRGAAGGAAVGAAAGIGAAGRTNAPEGTAAGSAAGAGGGDEGPQIAGPAPVDAAGITTVARESAEAAKIKTEPPRRASSPGKAKGGSGGIETAKTPAPEESAPPEPSPEELLAKQVADVAMRWSLSVVGDAIATLEVMPLASQAAQSMSTADLAGVDSARAAIGAALSRFATIVGERKADMDSLSAQGADVQALRDLYLKGYVATLGGLLDPRYVANPFVLWTFQGKRGPIGLEGYRGGIPKTALSGDPAADVAASLANADQLVERFRPILIQVPAIRRWAESLDPARAADYSGLAKEIVQGPLSGKTGRERQILQAVAIDAAPPEWSAVLRCDERKLAAQVQAEDTQMLADGYGKPPALDAARFAKLDDAARTLASEAESSYVDDKVAMAALDTANTPAEKEYLLRRMRDLDVYNKVYHGLDADNQETFDRKRADAGNFGGTAGEASRDVTAGRAVGQAARMLPGAVYSELVGAGQAIPILGDIIEEEWGEEARKTVLAIHRAAGVDAESAELSASIGTGAGKLAASIGFAGVGGAGAATTKTGQVIGKTVEVADTLNDVTQAVTGRTITGEEISLGERIAAGVGPVFGSAAKVVSKGGKVAGKGGKVAGKADVVADGGAKGRKSSKRLVDDSRRDHLNMALSEGDADSVISIDEIQRLAGGSGAPDQTLRAALEGADVGAAALGTGMEVARESQGQSQAQSETVARTDPATDAKVLAQAQGWIGANPGHPLGALVQKLLDEQNAERLRMLFG